MALPVWVKTFVAQQHISKSTQYHLVRRRLEGQDMCAVSFPRKLSQVSAISGLKAFWAAKEHIKLLSESI